jgi:hypothetical protein
MGIGSGDMDIRFLMHVLLLLLASFSLASAQDGYRGQKGMYSIQPAERWEDALISGNGTMGIMVYGDPVHEKIIFNHELLYEPIGSENVEPPDIAKYLDQTRELFKQEKYAPIKWLWRKDMLDCSGQILTIRHYGWRLIKNLLGNQLIIPGP